MDQHIFGRCLYKCNTQVVVNPSQLDVEYKLLNFYNTILLTIPNSSEGRRTMNVLHIIIIIILLIGLFLITSESVLYKLLLMHAFDLNAQ